MQTVAPRLWTAVDEQTRNRIQLIAEVEPNRADRRVIPEPWTDVVPQIGQIDPERLAPHVAAIQEQHDPEVAVEGRAQFLAELEHAVAADRKPPGERAHFEAAPAAEARRTAEEKLLGKRDIRRAAGRTKVPELQPAGEHDAFAERQIVTGILRDRVVMERPRHQPSRFLGVKRQLVAVMGVEEVVRGAVLQIESERVQLAALL